MYGCISLSFLPKKELQIAEREKKTYFAYLCHCKYFWIFLQEHRSPHGDVCGGLMPRIHVHDEDVNDVDAGCRNGCADGDRERHSQSLTTSHTHARTRGHREVLAAAPNATTPGTLSFIPLVLATARNPVSPPRPLRCVVPAFGAGTVHAWRGENAAGPHRERSTALALHQTFMHQTTR